MSDKTRTYEVTLKVTVDRGYYNNPNEWIWHELLDLPEENVTLINSERKPS